MASLGSSELGNLAEAKVGQAPESWKRAVFLNQVLGYAWAGGGSCCRAPAAVQRAWSWALEGGAGQGTPCAGADEHSRDLDPHFPSVGTAAPFLPLGCDLRAFSSFPKE